MTIHHLASDDWLLSYASGHLSPAPALVLASHLELSPESARRLREIEGLGGAMLDEQPLADVDPLLFERVLERLDEPAPATSRCGYHDHGRLNVGVALPSVLNSRAISKWHWIAPGIRFANVDVPEDPAYKVVMLRVAAGKALPSHGHSGSELTLVLKGSFRDEDRRYGPGDIEEEDDTRDHQPVVDDDGECICLAAIEGSMRPHSRIVRLIQPLLGF